MPRRPEMSVRRQRNQSGILHRASNCEVIEALELVAGKAEQRVEGIIKIAADTRGSNARRLGLQIEHVP